MITQKSLNPSPNLPIPAYLAIQIYIALYGLLILSNVLYFNSSINSISIYNPNPNLNSNINPNTNPYMAQKQNHWQYMSMNGQGKIQWMEIGQGQGQGQGSGMGIRMGETLDFIMGVVMVASCFIGGLEFKIFGIGLYGYLSTLACFDLGLSHPYMVIVLHCTIIYFYLESIFYFHELQIYLQQIKQNNNSYYRDQGWYPLEEIIQADDIESKKYGLENLIKEGKEEEILKKLEDIQNKDEGIWPQVSKMTQKQFKQYYKKQIKRYKQQKQKLSVPPFAAPPTKKINQSTSTASTMQNSRKSVPAVLSENASKNSSKKIDSKNKSKNRNNINEKVHEKRMSTYSEQSEQCQKQKQKVKEKEKEIEKEEEKEKQIWEGEKLRHSTSELELGLGLGLELKGYKEFEKILEEKERTREEKQRGSASVILKKKDKFQ